MAFGLVLFDIDGTLVKGNHGTHWDAIKTALVDVAGIEPSEVAELVAKVDANGRTDRFIISELLRRAGKPETMFDDVATRTTALATAAYAKRTDGAAYALPGTHALLQSLADRNISIGLVTGNLPDIAEAKLRFPGLWSYFEQHVPFIHGYGDVSEDRNDLARHAARQINERYGDAWDPFHTWIVGDTPRDIECARAIDARVLAVTTGHFDAQALADADIVVATLDQVTIDDLA
jgi:phosphoglycolate phosphatase